MQSHRPWVQPQVAVNRGQREQSRLALAFINHAHLADDFNFTIFIYLIIFLLLVLWDEFAVLYINFPRNIILSISNYLLGKLLCKMFIGREEDPYQWFICIMQMNQPRGTTTLLPPLTVGYRRCRWKQSTTKVYCTWLQPCRRKQTVWDGFHCVSTCVYWECW